MNGNLDQQFSISRIYHACRIGESALSASRARQLLLLILANRTLTLQGLGTQGRCHTFESGGAQAPKIILGPFCFKKWRGPTLLLPWS